jgi:hypothetical protein
LEGDLRLRDWNTKQVVHQTNQGSHDLVQFLSPQATEYDNNGMKLNCKLVCTKSGREPEKLYKFIQMRLFLSH